MCVIYGNYLVEKQRGDRLPCSTIHTVCGALCYHCRIISISTRLFSQIGIFILASSVDLSFTVVSVQSTRSPFTFFLVCPRTLFSKYVDYFNMLSQKVSNDTLLQKISKIFVLVSSIMSFPLLKQEGLSLGV